MNATNIYLNIRKYREHKNHSIDYVAIQMEMSVKMYLKIEKGTVDLKLSTLDRLVKILGVKKSEVFSLEN